LRFVSGFPPTPRYFVNFAKWRLLYDKARAALWCHPGYGSPEISVTLLAHKLRSMRVDPDFDQELEKRGKVLREQERKVAATSRIATDDMGWT
jgi:hypothetical protein